MESLSRQNVGTQEYSAQQGQEVGLTAMRLASVDQLDHAGNPKLTSKQIGNLSGRVSEENPFVAKARNGQITWLSEAPVNAQHVREIVELTTGMGRNLHINTGTHGDEEGNTVTTNIGCGEAGFSKQDMQAAWKKENVSIHIVSQASPAIRPDNIDVIDAWCYSVKSDEAGAQGQQLVDEVLQQLAVPSSDIAQLLESLNRPQEVHNTYDYSQNQQNVAQGNAKQANIQGGNSGNISF